ncbi:MAG: glycine oxidase ThiO, partial [Chromatiales bacterium]
GLIGMLTARELDSAGMRVVLVERGETGQESSWAGGGILSPLYPWRYAPSVTALAGWSQRRYEALSLELRDATGVDPEWTPSGMLILDTDERDQARDWAAATGARVEPVGAGRIAELEPALAGPPDQALWMPDLAQVRNPRAVAALRADLDRRGVEVRENTEVLKILASGARVRGLQTSEGTLEADTLVVCAGAWTAGLLDQLGVVIQVEPVRGQMLLFGAEPGAITRMVLQQGHYVIPRRDGHVLMGSTLEYSGFRKETTDAALAELSAIALRQFPVLARYPIKRQWAGLRPGSPQGIPYIGPFPGIRGLFVNSGHFRNGVVLGPGSARLLADLVLEREPILPPEPYALKAPRE